MISVPIPMTVARFGPSPEQARRLVFGGTSACSSHPRPGTPGYGRSRVILAEVKSILLVLAPDWYTSSITLL